MQKLESIVNHFDGNNLPRDWQEATKWHGFSRVNSSRRYDVKLSVLGAQRYLGTASSQHNAAVLYDLALWKLAVFIGPRLKPNFPDEFSSINGDYVAEHCPLAIKLYGELVKVAGLAPGLTEEDHRQRKIDEGLNRGKAEVSTSLLDYDKAVNAISKARAIGIENTVRIQRLRMVLDFAKLPLLDKQFANLLNLIAQVDTAAAALNLDMVSHRNYYDKIVQLSQCSE